MVSEHGREQWVAEKTVKLGGGAGVARRGLRAAMATAELRALGGCCSEEERRPEAKWELGRGRADAGGVKAAPRRVVACADRPRPGATRRPWPNGGRPLNQPIQFVSRER